MKMEVGKAYYLKKEKRKEAYNSFSEEEYHIDTNLIKVNSGLSPLNYRKLTPFIPVS